MMSAVLVVPKKLRNVPIACRWLAKPDGEVSEEPLTAETAMDCRVEVDTVTDTVPVTVPTIAEMRTPVNEMFTP